MLEHKDQPSKNIAYNGRTDSTVTTVYMHLSPSLMLNFRRYLKLNEVI